jgi:hypothetical protein
MDGSDMSAGTRWSAGASTWGLELVSGFIWATPKLIFFSKMSAFRGHHGGAPIRRINGASENFRPKGTAGPES